MKTQDYCGCCGNEVPYGEWCLKCTAHLKPAERGLSMWDRTYFAQHGKDCPFQFATTQPTPQSTENAQ